MLKHIINIILLLCSLSSLTTAQAQENNEVLSKALENAGFENISISAQNQNLRVALENNVYRRDIEAISAAIDTIVPHAPNKSKVSIYWLKNGIPQLQINVSPQDYNKNKKSTETESQNAFEVTYQIDENWENLKNKTAVNPNHKKIDLVIYPQLLIQNLLLTQLYEIQFNIAPALEMDLWKGMKFTGQLILPVINELGDWGDMVRPGFLTLAQSFRMGKTFFARAVVGNFNAGRYGLDATVYHPLFNNRVELEGNIGLTGSSRFYDHRWQYTSMDQLSWFIRARYYPSIFNLQMGLSYGQYLEGDRGIRADLTRHFGDIAIGFYAMYTGNKSNGGFHFALPLRSRKRNRTKAFRAVAPKYFDWEYTYGTEYTNGKNGLYYETEPNKNRIENNYNPIYINKYN